MVRRLFPLLFVFLFVACTTAPPGLRAGASVATAPSPVAEPAVAVTPQSPASPAAPPAATAEPSGERALAHVRVLALEIGPRPVGSEGERRAAEYIAGQLRAYGYEVRLQPFPVRTFVSRRAELRVTAPTVETLRTSPLANSPAGTAAGELFVAGRGLPQDYPAEGINGRIALVQRGQIEFGEKLRNAAAAGASAMVIYDPPNDLFAGRLTGQLPPIPALIIPGPDGVRLRELATGGPVRVALVFEGGVEEHTATNVIGRPPGKGCAAVVGGHFDTVEASPGASDNASGTAAMLEMARVQARRGNPEQACFIAFSAEELGLLGSIHFLQQLSDAERQAIHFMINLDMVAVGEEWLFIGTPALQRRGQEVAETLGISGRRADLVGASSDHAAFMDRRIPALMLHRSNDSLLHTPEDTVDRIAAPPLETAVRLGLAWLTAFSQS